MYDPVASVEQILNSAESQGDSENYSSLSQDVKASIGNTAQPQRHIACLPIMTILIAVGFLATFTLESCLPTKQKHLFQHSRKSYAWTR